MQPQVPLIRTQRDVSVDGLQLHVQQLSFEGKTERPPIVFLHDSFGSIKLWRTFPERIAASLSADAISFDRQGHGESQPFASERTVTYMEDEAHILLHLLEKLNIDKCILFGHSDGGSIALIAASLDPDRVAAVVTEGAHVFVEEETLAGIRTTVGEYDTTDLKQRLERYHGDKTDALFHAWSDTWGAPWFRKWNIEKYLSGIKCPALIIQGTADEYGTERQVDAIVSQVAGPAKKLMIASIGHTPHKEAQHETADAVIAFLKEAVPPLSNFAR